MEEKKSNTNLKNIYRTNSSQETQRVGKDLGKSLQGGIVIALHGDLGAGKTTFVQGIADGLGVTGRIISPTFIIVRTYETNKAISSSSGASAKSRSSDHMSSRQVRTITFYHIDLYRTETEADLKGLGIEEIINNPENVVAIEWAEKMGNVLPKERIEILFEHLEGEKRKITISKITNI